LDALAIFEFFVDGLFIADIVVIFRTTFIHPMTGEEIIDSKAIAWNYILSTRFPVDVLASFPFVLLMYLVSDAESWLLLLGVLKIFRILRLGKIITFM
jgi:hypothetical protein